jgi:hypothetical protein
MCVTITRNTDDLYWPTMPSFYKSFKIVLSFIYDVPVEKHT